MPAVTCPFEVSRVCLKPYVFDRWPITAVATNSADNMASSPALTGRFVLLIASSFITRPTPALNPSVLRYKVRTAPPSAPAVNFV